MQCCSYTIKHIRRFQLLSFFVCRRRAECCSPCVVVQLRVFSRIHTRTHTQNAMRTKLLALFFGSFLGYVFDKMQATMAKVKRRHFQLISLSTRQIGFSTILFRFLRYKHFHCVSFIKFTSLLHSASSLLLYGEWSARCEE